MSKFLVLSTATCPWCTKVKAHLTELGHEYHEIIVNEQLHPLLRQFGLSTVPQVFELVGGYEDTVQRCASKSS